MKKYLKEIISNPLFSGSAVMIIGSNSASGLNYLYHFIVNKLLVDPSLYGELAALISLIGLVGVIPGALSLVIVKEISSAKDDVEASNLIKWFKTKIFLGSLFFSVLVLIFSPLISSFLNINNTFYIMAVAGFILFSLQSAFNRSILQGLLKFKEFVLSILLENGIKLILTILLIYTGLKVGGALWALIISAIIGLLITNYFLKYKSEKKANFSPNTKSMFKFAIPVMIQTTAITSLFTSDLILVKHYFSSHETGIYAALSTLSKIIFFATGPIGTVMFPLVSKRKAKGESFRKIFIYSFSATTVFVISSLLIYAFFPEFIIKLPYGTAYLEGTSMLVWFGLFISLFTLSSLLISYNLSLGKTKVSFFPLIAAICQIILIILFHQSILTVIIISILVTALLLISLLIYSSYGDKINFRNSASVQTRKNYRN